MSITKLLTAEDLFTMGSDAPYELIEGELHAMPGSGQQSSFVGGRILISIGIHLKSNPIGFVTGEAGGFVLWHNPDTVVFPDVGFIRRERQPSGQPVAEFCPVPPDLAVEVMSPWDRLPEAEAKVRRYLAAGVPLIWLVKPASRSVAVHRPDRPVEEVVEGGILDGGDVLPGFMLSVAEIFSL